ncbi:MAG: CDP-glucose 4,6-dehydratase [Pedosphaera sp.]|nr:CDP-glucose 4,6-dehydratase [Pedosphaera sp.]
MNIPAIPHQEVTPQNERFGGCFENKTVFVTGHTGFKGSWLCEWLLFLKAKVVGYSLSPDSDPSLFEQLQLADRLHHRLGDIRDPTLLRTAVEESQPDFVFHLAAQPLVRRSYLDPVETYATNVTGTLHLIEALRALSKPCAALFITTDKCYENRDWVYGYRENDALGGHDPYSSSKAAAEIAIASWRRSFFQNHPVRIASVRAGNVIGGGDWAADRIVPDCMRALRLGQPILVRNPNSTRPWQHVLEPLSGYLWLAAKLSQSDATLGAGVDALDTAFNFGPGPDANRTVRELVEEIIGHWPGQWTDGSESNAPHEARLLQLSCDKASALLDWQPTWEFTDAIRETTRWYRDVLAGGGVGFASRVTLGQISAYTERASALCRAWAVSPPNI